MQSWYSFYGMILISIQPVNPKKYVFNVIPNSHFENHPTMVEHCLSLGFSLGMCGDETNRKQQIYIDRGSAYEQLGLYHSSYHCVET
jgi:hypothetical protein